ncbi:MAG: N-acetylglucosamine kinase [Cyanobacteria bacterium]|nr:N-acetylglucosamine kinase [Cyanobacteria bacterium bin.51]
MTATTETGAIAGSLGPLLAGFDAGQTHTTCRLARLLGDGRLITVAEGTGAGVSHLAASGGPERFALALTSSLGQALGPGARPDLAAAAIGASGIEQGTTIQEQGRALAAAVLAMPPPQVLVTGDERTALRGAHGDLQGNNAGIVVISGTGSIALGQDSSGREHRCGGWGWLLDRSGSACDIGRDALSLSLEMADGRRRESPLRQAIWQALAQPASPQAIKALAVDPNFGAAGFARLAPTVDGLAARGDAEAQAVLDASALGLAGLVHGVARALAMERAQVCALGGALTHLPRFAAAFGAALGRVLPDASTVAARGDACQGALWLAAGSLPINSLRIRPR